MASPQDWAMAGIGVPANEPQETIIAVIIISPACLNIGRAS
jgi:hypothetical protein